MRLKFENFTLRAVGFLLAAFLVFPVLALFVASAPRELLLGLQHPLVWPALRLSLLTTTTTTLVVVFLGTPLAWSLAQSKRKGIQFIETLLQLPLVIPPSVAGIAMLLAFGNRGLLSALLHPAGNSLAFTTTAVIMAQVFVSAPLFIQSASSAFRRIDAKLVVVAQTFGALPWSVFFRVALPLALPGLAAGAAVSWSRALGEFGATLMFAGNLEGKTQTLPLAIYTAFTSDIRAAQAISIILVLVAFALLLLMRVFMKKAERKFDGMP
ncbi:MAG: ABC transporter permease [Cystobacterineae bacterium]|nr:ABC transporter permease [Cystobacterineae bacterium]